jgi:hypothetical protein
VAVDTTAGGSKVLSAPGVTASQIISSHAKVQAHRVQVSEMACRWIYGGSGRPSPQPFRRPSSSIEYGVQSPGRLLVVINCNVSPVSSLQKESTIQ